MINNYSKGIIAEHIAAAWLRLKGYRILKRRFRCYAGEIDLIICKKNILVFVEVKSRNKTEDFLEVINEKQKRNIVNASLYYINKNAYLAKYFIRYDVVFIKLPFRLQHINNAFESYL